MVNIMMNLENVSQKEKELGSKKECAPTYTCKDNTAVDLSNAAFISAHEQPYENAPEVNPPIFPLAQDFLKDLVLLTIIVLQILLMDVNIPVMMATVWYQYVYCYWWYDDCYNRIMYCRSDILLLLLLQE